jgi:hypothetical protein
MPTKDSLPTEPHEHYFDSENGYRNVGGTLMLYCACGASKLFAPEPEKRESRQPGKLLHFPVTSGVSSTPS